MRISAGGCAVSAAFVVLNASAAPTPVQIAYADTLKGGSHLSAPRPLPEKHLGLLPAAPRPHESTQGANESTPGADVVPLGSPAGETLAQCSPQLDAAPMVVGARDQYAKVGGLVKNVGMGLLAKALSGATGGALQSGGKSKGKEEALPPLHEDPIKKKFRSRIKDKASGAKLSLGGQLADDGLLLSTRLDDADGDGTLHEVYLEREDCRRIYPSAEYAYELWGKWSLSVSWTRTTSTYQDGNLVDQQSTSGGFERASELSPVSGSGLLDLSEALADVPAELRGEIGAYQARLRDEMQQPLWQRAGFGAPTSGARSFGTLYRLSAADRTALADGRLRAVVQVTRERGPVFEAVGIPVTLSPGESGHLTFAALPR